MKDEYLKGEGWTNKVWIRERRRLNEWRMKEYDEEENGMKNWKEMVGWINDECIKGEG